MSIIVQRQPANKSGPSIVSSVLTTVAAQLERGTHEINTNNEDRVTVQGNIPDVLAILPAQMVKLDIKGREKVGQVTNYSGSIRIGDKLNIRSQITVETIK